MGVSEESLKSKMVAELTARGFEINSGIRDNTDWLNLFLEAISKAVVDEIHENAVTEVVESHSHKVL